MFKTSIVSFVLLCCLALLERSFLAAASGGAWAADLVLAVAAARMTSFDSRGAFLWVVSAAFVSEIFGVGTFGAVAAGAMIGLASARLLLFYLLSHRSTLSRAAAAALGAAIGIVAATLFRLSFSLVSGDVFGVAGIHDLIGSATVKIAATATAAGVATIVWVGAEERVRWLFDKGAKRSYAVS